MIVTLPFLRNFLLFLLILLALNTFSQEESNYLDQIINASIPSNTDSQGHKYYEYFYGRDYKLRPDTELQISEYIRRIFQDSKGNLWFATNANGVCKYDPLASSKVDGNTLTYYSTNEGLGGSQVTGIIEDKVGNIWFSTSGGVSKFDGKSIVNYTVKDGLSDNRVLSIMEDGSGKIWVGTVRGLCIFNGSVFEPFAIPGYANILVWDIEEDSRGNLWFAIDCNGVCEYDPKADKDGGQAFNFITKKEGLNSNSVTSILEDNKGNFWFGTRFDGVIRYTPPSDKSIDGSYISFNVENNDIGNNEVWTVFQDRSGYVWFSSEGYGIYQYDGIKLRNYSKKEGLPIHAVQSIYQDREGRFWIGGGNGLYRLIGRSFINITKNGPWDDGC